eukprot:998444-Prymnesium_polylepis.1
MGGDGDGATRNSLFHTTRITGTGATSTATGTSGARPTRAAIWTRTTRTTTSTTQAWPTSTRRARVGRSRRR